MSAFLLDLISIILVMDCVNEGLSSLQSCHVLDLLPGQVLLELEFNLVHIDFRVKHARLVGLQNVMKFLQALVRRQCFWLHFVLVRFFVQRETVSGDRRIYC